MRTPATPAPPVWPPHVAARAAAHGWPPHAAAAVWQATAAAAALGRPVRPARRLPR